MEMEFQEPKRHLFGWLLNAWNNVNDRAKDVNHRHRRKLCKKHESTIKESVCVGIVYLNIRFLPEM